MLTSPDFVPVDQRLWNTSLVGLAYVSKMHKWGRINPTLCQMLEYSEVELTGEDIALITVPQDMDATAQMLTKLLTNGISFFITALRFVTKTGNIIWVKARIDLIKNDEGQPDYFLMQAAPAHVVAFCPPQDKSSRASALSTPVITDEEPAKPGSFSFILGKVAKIVQDVRVTVIAIGLVLGLVGKMGFEWIGNLTNPKPLTVPELEEIENKKLDEILDLIKSNAARIEDLEKNK